MKEKSFSKPEASSSMPMESSLALCLKTFLPLLSEQGYTRSTMRRKQWLVGKLDQWFSQQSLKLEELNEQKINQFIELEGVKVSTRRGDRATLRLLLQHGENLGFIPSSERKEEGPLRCIEQDFVQYLSQERGLSPATLIRYSAMVRCFLTEHFGHNPIHLETLKATDITRFIQIYVPKVQRKTATLMASSLRSFFRYLFVNGILMRDLAEFVPTVADWRMSDIPKFLEPEEVKRLLDYCDQSSPAGQRDYAILLLLARLGLRAGEIAKMKLEDFNWDSGELLIHGKGAITDRFPLPHDVGKAVAIYLQQSRPTCSTRLVFVRLRAPYQGFSSSVAICNIVQRALLRANLHPIHRGAHLLRHSLATRLLTQGASLAEIGEVLRHRSVQTTELYAKVDKIALQSLAQPWLGGEL